MRAKPNPLSTYRALTEMGELPQLISAQVTHAPDKAMSEEEQTSVTVSNVEIQPRINPDHFGDSYQSLSHGLLGPENLFLHTIGVSLSSGKQNQMIVKLDWPGVRTNHDIVTQISHSVVYRLGNEERAKGGDISMQNFGGLTDSAGDDLKFAPDVTAEMNIHLTSPRMLRTCTGQNFRCIEELQGYEFLRAWLDCYHAHFDLWSKGIEHGDISMRNLMYDPVTKRGVLCNYDPATACSLISSVPSCTNDTETMLLMAVDLFSDGRHDGHATRLYRHDLESFIWALPSVLLRGVGDKQNATPSMRITSDIDRCKMNKIYYLTSRFRNCEVASLNEGAWQVCRALLLWLRLKWERANDIRDGVPPSDLDVNTLWQDPSMEAARTLYNEVNELIRTKNVTENVPIEGSDYAPKMIKAEDTQDGDCPRIPRATARKLRCISELDGEEFLDTWLDCYHSHFDLWLKGIRFDDISLQKLMYDPISKRGVLYDCDLAVGRPPKISEPLCRDCTSIVPFTPLDLLRDEEDYADGGVVRLYRHDLESFIWALPYVLLWDASANYQTYRLRRWNTRHYDNCRYEKKTFLQDFLDDAKTTKPVNERAWQVGRALLLWFRQRWERSRGDDKEEETLPTDPDVDAIWGDSSEKAAHTIYGVVNELIKRTRENS